jgi:hypothetical protein
VFFKQAGLKTAMVRDEPACPPSLLLVSGSPCVIIARQAPHLIVQGYVPPTLRVHTVAYKYNSSGGGGFTSYNNRLTHQY